MLTAHARPTIHGRSLMIGALVLVAASALGAQGLSYDIRSTITNVDPRSGVAATRTSMAAHGQFARGMSRLDITESMSPAGSMMGAGTYIITKPAKGTTTIVDPAAREYTEVNPAELAKTVAGLQQALGGLSKTEVSDITVTMEDLGAGESIEGYATVKYRLTQGHTMTMSTMGMRRSTTSRSTTEFWVAPQLDGAMNPTARPVAGNAPTGPTAELTARLAQAYSKVRKGIILKSIANVESSAGGKSNTGTMTMTVTNVKRAAIDPAVFDVPSGYAKAASPLDALSPLGAMSDSVTAARTRSGKNAPAGGISSTLGEAVDSAKSGAKEGITEEAKDDAKEKAKRALGRIFGRPR
ncbi:MAG: DUF4412 domain-containing protein [Gemmatimonadota bacterium]|nr:DUF4412 domain-containing protein [Gemmatimonadota bacterium]